MNKDSEKVERIQVNIQLDETTTLMADTYQWILVQKGRYRYYPRLDQVFEDLFETRVRGTKTTTLQELADSIVATKVEILDMLKPFCHWSDQGIHMLLKEDLEKSVREALVR